MIRTQVQFSEHQMEALKLLAATRKVSVAELVRNAVDALFQAEPVRPMAERRERALKATGRFSSGHHDISVEHDRYLAECFES